MTDPAALLAGALPADPGLDGPIAIPDSGALRKVLTELHTHRLAHHVITNSAIPDGGA